MNSRANLQESVWLFIVLSLAFSCLYWFLGWLHSSGFTDLDPRGGFWGVLRGYGPAIAAVLTASFAGRVALRRLGSRVVRWRIPWYCYALALLGPLFVNGLAITMTVALTGAEIDAGGLQPGRAVLVFLVLPFLDGPVGEEIGWRGLLLPALLARMQAFQAGLVVGLVWFLWHIPLYATDGRELTVGFLLLYGISVITQSVIYTWLFRHSRESALVAILLHAATNYFIFIGINLIADPAARTFYNRSFVAVVVVLSVIAGFALWRQDRRSTDETVSRTTT